MDEEGLSAEIESAVSDPERLEMLYRTAVTEGPVRPFRETVVSLFQRDPDNVLLAAWYHRLKTADISAPTRESARHQPNWWLALAIGAAAGAILWAISDPGMRIADHLPYVALLWAPVVAVSVMSFLVVAGDRGLRRAGPVGVALAVATAYAILIATTLEGMVQNHYVDLMGFHLPLLAFVAVGVTLVGLPEDPGNRFAYLSKSLEVFITAGLFAIGGAIFAGMTAGLFQTLGVEFPDWLIRLALSFGVGMIPVLAVATVYDPGDNPASQNFSYGLSRLIATLMRILLPLTCGALLVYLFYIPFSFMEPFENREVLIVYNVMLFAVMALLVGAIPVTAEDLSERLQFYLRRGIVALACLAVVVSIYALAAIIYRTAGGGITVNRLTVIGWNSINILTLILLVLRQAHADRESWLGALHSVFSTAAYAYVAWGLFVVIAVPLIFR